jgi:hypothetical protein
MSFITFQCYACNQMLKVGADKAGRKAKCNKCGTALTIPVASTVQEPAAAPPPPAAAPPPLPPTPARPTPVPAQVAPTPVAPAEECLRRLPPEDFDDEPRRRRRPREDEVFDDEEDVRVRRPVSLWPRVRLGLLLVFIGMCVLAGAFVLELVVYLLATIDLVRLMTSARGVGSGTGDTAIVLLRVSLLVQLGAAITSIVGYVFSMLGPNKRGMMGMAIATLAVAGLELLLTLIFKVPSFFSRGGGPFSGPGGDPGSSVFGAWLVLLLIQLLFSAAFILFPLYLRAASLALKARAQARACMAVFIVACIYAGERLLTYIFWYIVLQASMERSTRSDPRALVWITLILLWLGAFAFGALIVWYIIVLWRTRAEIE